MKKIISIALAIMLIMLFSSCSSESKDNILSASGHLFADIESISVTNDEAERVELDKSDCAFLKDYSENYAFDRFNELFLFPSTKHILVTFSDKSTMEIYALRNGELVYRPLKSWNTCRAYVSNGVIADGEFLKELTAKASADAAG